MSVVLLVILAFLGIIEFALRALLAAILAITIIGLVIFINESSSEFLDLLKPVCWQMISDHTGGAS